MKYGLEHGVIDVNKDQMELIVLMSLYTCIVLLYIFSKSGNPKIISYEVSNVKKLAKNKLF